MLRMFIRQSHTMQNLAVAKELNSSKSSSKRIKLGL